MDAAREKTLLIYLIMRYLEEMGYIKTLHKLEKESSVYFNFAYLVHLINEGDFDVAVDYISCFTAIDDNIMSGNLFARVNVATSRVFRSKRRHRRVKTAVINELSGLVSQNPLLGPRTYFPSMARADLFFLIHQFFEEEGFEETMEMFQRECKVRFNLKFVVDCMMRGDCIKASYYLTEFIDSEFLQPLMAMSVIMQEQLSNKNAHTRENVKSWLYGYVKEFLIDADPTLEEKMEAPLMEASRLQTVVKPIMDWWRTNSDNLRHMNDRDIYAEMFNSLKAIPKHPFLAIPFEPRPDGDVKDWEQAKYIRKIIAQGKSFFQGPKLIHEPSELKSLALHDNSLDGKMVKVLYLSSGDGIVALAENRHHKHWKKWTRTPQSSEENDDQESYSYQLTCEEIEINERDHVVSIPCFVQKDGFLILRSEDQISVFNLELFKTAGAVVNQSPNKFTSFTHIFRHTFAAGVEDNSISIHCSRTRQTIATLYGHEQNVKRLVFSRQWNLLVSVGADTQICSWHAKGWEYLSRAKLCDTDVQRSNVIQVQFHPTKLELLVVLEDEISIIDPFTLQPIDKGRAELVEMIDPVDRPMTCATYSCDGKSIFVGCRSGCVQVYRADRVALIVHVYLNAYAEIDLIDQAYPVSIAAHPHLPNQFAVGLSDGTVYVMEPFPSGESS